MARPLIPEKSEPTSTRATFLCVITYVDGTVHYELHDDKTTVNGEMAEVIEDPEVADWVIYQLVKAK